MTSCVVLFSGGIDSTTALYWAKTSYGKVAALSFDYGQRHKVELTLARRLTRRLQIPHPILRIDLRQIGGSSITDIKIPLPRFKQADEIEPGVPLTYVPFRNGIFLSLAAAWAEVQSIREIICGFHTADSPNYPDTTASFVRAMERAANLGTTSLLEGRKLRIIAPFIRLRKSEIIKRGLSLGVDYSYSISCYTGREIPCRECSSCLLRQRAWDKIGTEDHLLLRLKKEGKL